MSQAAAQALAKYAGSSDPNAAEKVVRLLLGNEGISGRADPSDLAAAVDTAAGRVANGELPEDVFHELEQQFAAAEGTELIGIFPAASVSGTWKAGPVQIGPASGLPGPIGPLLGAHREAILASTNLTVRVSDDALGVLGRRRALQWLRCALGALYLAGRIHGGADARVGPLPADELEPSLFVGPPGHLNCLVQEMRLPTRIPLDIDALLSGQAALELVQDCLSPDPSDLVGRRLQDAAQWVQVGFDALLYPEAVLALGVALEALIGSESSADVVKVVSTRTAFLLRSGSTREEWVLSGRQLRETTKRLYGARSKVAHGRYEQGAQDEREQRLIRAEFEDLVCDVARRFRDEGRARGWQSDADMRAWQEDLELG